MSLQLAYLQFVSLIRVRMEVRALKRPVLKVISANAYRTLLAKNVKVRSSERNATTALLKNHSLHCASMNF